MQKRSHKLLAHTLLAGCDGFSRRRFELAFLFGSFEPDCNPLSYLKGSMRGEKFRGHNFSNSQKYIERRIDRLQCREQWSLWQYYTLGKLTHYLADAFTFPHNVTYQEGLSAHRVYEARLRAQFADYLEGQALQTQRSRADVVAAISRLHEQYLKTVSDWQRDTRYILQATSILMSGLLPQGA